MEQTTRVEIEEIVARENWTAEDCAELVQRVSSEAGTGIKFREQLAALERKNPDPRGATALKIGIGRYILSRSEQALEAFVHATDNKERHYFQAMCLKNLRQYDRAVEEFDRAVDRGWDAAAAEVERIECQALGGNVDAAEKALSKLKGKSQTADAFYLRGLVEELKGLGEAASDAYERARAVDPSHARATFRLAYYCDLHGEEGRAVELYKQCVATGPVYLSALLNLAVLYEDAGDYSAAAKCLDRVLATNPGHPRARLFRRDVRASTTMYFDEDQARRIAKHNAVLDIPVTDFELSVRARNCLRKMNIRSLGDLVNTTEAELLGYKNFGETSLREIKEMLTAKGLHLGQGQEEEAGLIAAASTGAAPAGNDAVLATPLDRLEFSIRSRTAMEGLGITTLGELSQRTEAELLACKNFGQSSLNEVRQRLTDNGLRLREPD